MDLATVLAQVEDHLVGALELDPLDKAIYYHLFRHTHLVGKDSGLFALVPLAQAVRSNETTVRQRIRSLNERRCIEIRERTKNGHLIGVRLPEEIPGVVPHPSPGVPQDLEALDFYTGRKYVPAILHRENGRCFYCLRALTPESCVLDHVISLAATTDHSYRNIVASCHDCNSHKQDTPAEDFLRGHYRTGLLSQTDLQGRLQALTHLTSGQLLPEL